MGTRSAIEWTDATWNPWQGCTKVSEACAHCYMFRDMRRYGRDPSIVRRSSPATFKLPLKRTRVGNFAIPAGWKVFTCSWSDWFHKSADAWRAEAWEIIRQRQDVIFQIVTKRTDRIRECLPADWGDGWNNVWLIATVENQHWADIRIQQLLDVPAIVRGLSCEPLLGPIDLGLRNWAHIRRDDCRIDWVIVGGESGPGARPMHPAWANWILEDCDQAFVPFFFKQWGEWAPLSPETPARPGSKLAFVDRAGAVEYHQFTGRLLNLAITEEAMVHVGKKAAGRLLGGREYNEFPHSHFPRYYADADTSV